MAKWTNSICPVHGVPQVACPCGVEPKSDLEDRLADVRRPARRRCPKGHETAVRPQGGGRFRCGICARTWEES